jgi:hypothetical protein
MKPLLLVCATALLIAFGSYARDLALENLRQSYAEPVHQLHPPSIEITP